MPISDDSSSEQLADSFMQWKAEHAELDKFVMEISSWMNEEAEWSKPGLAKACEHMSRLQERLLRHFTNEEELSNLLAKRHGTPTVETDAVSRQLDRDHRALTERLKAINAKLESARTRPDLWSSVVDDFNLFIDLLEQHEEQEQDSVRWLR